MLASCCYSLGLRVAKSISEDCLLGLLNVKARALLVVRGNESVARQARDRALLLRKGNLRSKGFRVEGMEYA